MGNAYVKTDWPVEKIRHWVEVDGKTHDWIGKQIGCQHQTVSKICKKNGIRTQRTGPRSGEGHPEWKGGRRLVGGYWHIYMPEHPNCHKKNLVAEHRLVMEKKLGRYLDPKEVVHHKDHDPQNNHPDNLMVFGKNSEHLRHELTGKCPNWTPEGFAKINKSGGLYANPKLLKPGESRQAQTNDRQTS